MPFDFNSIPEPEPLVDSVTHGMCNEITDAYGSKKIYDRGYFSGKEKFYIKNLFHGPGYISGYLKEGEKASTLGTYNCLIFEPQEKFEFPVDKFEKPIEAVPATPELTHFPTLVFQQVYAQIDCGTPIEKVVPDSTTDLYVVFLGVFKISKDGNSLIFEKIWDDHYFDRSKLPK